MNRGVTWTLLNQNITNSVALLRSRFRVASGRITLRSRHVHSLTGYQEEGERRRLHHTLSNNYKYCSTSHKAPKYSFLVQSGINYSPIVKYHLSSRRYEEIKSVADKTVKILSDNIEKEEKAKKKAEAQKSAAGVVPGPDIEIKQAVDASSLNTGGAASDAVEVKGPLHMRAWRRVVKEVKHYYHGFRLLFIDVKICTRYVWGVLHGRILTRRERKQLVRTTADLFRLVPFTVFIIVPFMEFLLPVALKLFPGLLPSTFKQSNKEKEKVKKSLKAKIEIAKFLQDTVEESSLISKGKHPELAQKFQVFLSDCREGGVTASTADIMRFTRLFEDDITLDNMTRDHLLALCRLLEINTIGTNRMIAWQLRIRMRQLKADDKAISSEGIGKLSVAELQVACRDRGMRAFGVPEWRLRFQLEQWLSMHLTENVPISLLLMTRALYLPEHLSKEEQLKTVMSKLPDNTKAHAELSATSADGKLVDNAIKLKLIKAEEEAIAREKQDVATENLEKVSESAAEEVLSEKEDLEKHTIKDKAQIIEEVSAADVVLKDTPAEPATPPAKREVPATPVSTPTAPTTASETSAAEEVKKEPEISSQEIEALEDVLEIIAEEKKIDIDQSSLNVLKDDVDDYKEDLSTLNTLLVQKLAGETQFIESKGAVRLSTAVNKMIDQLSGVTDNIHRQKQHIMEGIEVKQVRIKRSEELQNDEKALASLQEDIQKETDHVIDLNELVLSMKRLQKVPDETRLEKIAEVLDEDKDGVVNISQVLRVLQQIGTENVNITGKQMTDIIALLKKEEKVEQDWEDKQKKELEEKEGTKGDKSNTSDTKEGLAGKPLESKETENKPTDK